MFKKLGLLLLGLGCISGFCFAHQPRFPEGTQIQVNEPEISKAYYAQLSGDVHHYQIISDTGFDLYVNILAPDIPAVHTDLSVIIFKNGDKSKPFVTLDGINFQRTRFFEEFGHDSYLKGPEYSGSVSSGVYDIVVMSTNNDSSYSLAIGQIEHFDMEEGLNALHLIPHIKREFFHKSPLDFILSPMGRGIILIMYIVGFLFGFSYRLALRLLPHSRSSIRIHKNIGSADRRLRAFCGLALLMRAITTDRSLWLLFFSGFCFFEAIFSRCGFYALLGKSSCPLD